MTVLKFATSTNHICSGNMETKSLKEMSSDDRSPVNKVIFTKSLVPDWNTLAITGDITFNLG